MVTREVGVVECAFLKKTDVFRVILMRCSPYVSNRLVDLMIV